MIILRSPDNKILRNNIVSRVVKYGALYNWYAISKNGGSGTGSIAPPGWHLPSESEWITLFNVGGFMSTAGGRLKQVGTLEAGTGLWNTPNSGATDEFGFRILPGGLRTNYGDFGNINSWANFHANTITHTGWPRQFGFSSYSASAIYGNSSFKYGFSSRLIKNTSDHTPGETVTDIDGNIYATVKIGGQVWMAENLMVIHYNDGTPIPHVTNNAAWTALTTAGYCWHSNDINNGFTTVNISKILACA